MIALDFQPVFVSSHDSARRDVACYVSSTDDEPTDEEEFDYADCVAWAKQAAIKSL